VPRRRRSVPDPRDHGRVKRELPPSKESRTPWTVRGVHDCGGHPSPAAALPFRRQARGSWEPRLRDACGPWRRPSITPDLEEAGGDAIFPALFPSPVRGFLLQKVTGKGWCGVSNCPVRVV
jgi:hypothetical protein